MRYGTPRNRQCGLYLVEFAVTYALLMFALFACIEIARLMYSWSALTFATQRGARVAAVCPLNDPKIAEIAVFGAQSGSTTPMVSGVGVSNIVTTYQNMRGAAASNYADVRYVRVSVENYTHNMLLPNLLSGFVSPSFLSPSFSTTLPAESLGSNPDVGSRVCFA